MEEKIRSEESRKERGGNGLGFDVRGVRVP